MNAPEPLTPPDCDLRGMPYMELDVVRLLDSDFFAMTTGDEFKAGVALWGKSWNQIPAASLPLNDRVLAHLAGVSPKEWGKLKEMALHGWIECSDGRLYHPTVAEKAAKAWAERQTYRTEKTGEAERKARERQDRADMFAALKAANITVPWNAKTGDLRRAVADNNLTVAWTHAAHVTTSSPDTSRSERDQSRDMSQLVTRTVTAKRGNGRGNGKEEEEGFALVVASAPTVPIPAPHNLVLIAFDEYNIVAARAGLPVAKGLSDDRRRKLGAKLKEVGIENWRAALAKLEASPHCCGQNDRGWKADLDFVLQNKSWNRLIEGSYDARPAGHNDNRRGGWSALDMAAEAMSWPGEDAA